MGRRRGVWVAGVAVAGLLAVGCDDSVDEAGASTLFQLRTGECFTSAAGTSGRTVELDDVTTLPCTGVHDGEVFAVATHPAGKDDPYPGDDAVADFAAAECLQQFPGYTGSTYDDSDLEVASVRPDEDSWNDKDDRAVACVLYQKGEKLTGSRRKP
ncbi:MAG TPA: septum formation family protein [Acidimicrobiia bacterium]|nr:septum formation family protein [Acidimicrobiia bacterium]